MVIDMELDFDAPYFDKKEFYKILNEMTFEETINFLQYNSKYDVIKRYDNGLICYSTFGWSDNEELIDMVNNSLNYNFYKHFIGYMTGGHYYFHPTKRSYDFKLVLDDEGEE